MTIPSRKSKRRSVTIIAAIITAIATILAAVLVLIPEIWSPLPAEINITTHVSDQANGMSIPGAKVIFLLDGNSYFDYTDSSGNVTFRVNATRKSEAHLFIEHINYDIFDGIIHPSKDLNINVKLLSRDINTHKIIVRAVDGNTNTPIDGAKVVFLVNGEPYSKTTDSNGIALFTIDFMSETLDVDISISTANYEINRQQVTLRPNQVQDIRLNKNSNKLDVIPFESPGNSSTSTTISNISYDQMLSGSISEATQKDRYTFVGNPGDVILITMSRTEGRLWPQIRLYDPDGNEVKTTDSNKASIELSETLLKSGEYTIFVGDGFDGTLTGKYTLNLQKIH